MRSIQYDVAVVGLGAMGAAALYQLSKRRKKVIGFEQYALGHDAGSSHGESRIIRTAYFESPAYVPLAKRAFTQWRALEEEVREQILIPTGILEAGVPESKLIIGSAKSSRLHHLGAEALSPKAAMDRFPAFHFGKDWKILYQPDAGILRADLAVAAFVREANIHGAEVNLHGVNSIKYVDAGVEVITSDGAVTQAKSVIVAAGAWTGGLIPELDRYLKVTRQLVGWFEPSRPDLMTPKQCPVYFIEAGEKTLFYGFPDFNNKGVVKAASHTHGEALAAPYRLEQPRNGELDGLAADLSRYVPAAAGPTVAGKACLYTNTPDGHFVLDLRGWGKHRRMVLASPCSGHGFKFAPVVGEILADLATDQMTALDIRPFRLTTSRKARWEAILKATQPAGSAHPLTSATADRVLSVSR